ncbi:MAG: iron-sulfur cluster assembly accessory protein [Chloroflexi bacterium]|nr:iron-sulfur cluster assembly accessory protein [Chloroflexota bacterium]
MVADVRFSSLYFNDPKIVFNFNRRCSMATTELIEVSELAADKLVEILKEQGEDSGMLRVMVSPTPDGGYQHVLGVEEEANSDDIVIEAHSIKVVIDKDSAPLLEGAEIDYVDGLMRSGFVISNPNIETPSGGGCGSGACGCGNEAPASSGCGCGNSGGCGGGCGGH